MKNRAWQAVEFEILSKMATAGKTDPEIGVILGRTDREVFLVRKRLGIRSQNSNLTNPWTEAEMNLLDSMFRRGCTDAMIAERLERSLDSVRTKRHALGLGQEERAAVRIVATQQRTANALLQRGPVSPSDPWEDKACASTAFLISLLRAGHTPGEGEFNIASEGRPVPHCQLVGA